MLSLVASIASQYFHVPAIGLLIALTCGHVSCNNAELASTDPLPWERGLSALGNLQSMPRDVLTQLQCQDVTVCPDCTALVTSVVETVLSGQCSPSSVETAEVVSCNGHRLLQATVEQLQQGHCFDMCTSEAATLCSQLSRKLLQSSTLRHSSGMDLFHSLAIFKPQRATKCCSL